MTIGIYYYNERSREITKIDLLEKKTKSGHRHSNGFSECTID